MTRKPTREVAKLLKRLSEIYTYEDEEMTDDILKANYPMPDPEWDYFVTWNRLQEAKQLLEEALSFMAEIENADDTSDKQIVIKIATVENKLLSAYGTVNEKAEEDLPY